MIEKERDRDGKRDRLVCVCDKDRQIRQIDRNSERVIVLEVEVSSSSNK